MTVASTESRRRRQGRGGPRSRRIHLVYYSYGQGEHTAQIAYSILTAVRFGAPVAGRGPVGISVFSDRPQDYEELPVEVVPVAPEQLRAWRGPHELPFLIKPEILRVALTRYGTPCVLVDADTYFRRDPARLASRLGPGRSLMHIRECRLGEASSPSQRQIAEGLRGASFSDLTGDRVVFEPGFPLWNAGVVGLDPADRPLLEEITGLSNQLSGHVPPHFPEQLATAYFLSRRTRLRAAADVIYHYWPYKLERRPPYRPTEWARRVPVLVDRTAGLAPERRGAELIKHAYRPPLRGPAGRIAVRLDPALAVVGRRAPAVRRSA